MKKPLLFVSVLLLSLLLIAGCVGSNGNESDKDNEIDYLVLVNKLNELPKDWEEKLRTVHITNSVGDDVEVEKRAYEAYVELKKELEGEGVRVDLDSARRSVAAQQKIVDDFTEKYGAEYTAKVVAKPGYSEHHTGLALDLYLIIDGKDVVENEDMVQYPEIWAKIHEKLAKHGFILRYLEGKEHVTGYAYEPWHIRYVNDPKIAKEITEKGITLESYLGAAKETDPALDFGNSKLYTKEELSDAFVNVKCQMAAWKGVELTSLKYAGDECSSEENLKWVNSLEEGTKYTKAIEILSSFRTPKEDAGAFDPDKDYTDYQWWLACGSDGDWNIVSSGY